MTCEAMFIDIHTGEGRQAKNGGPRLRFVSFRASALAWRKAIILGAPSRGRGEEARQGTRRRL